MKRMSAVRWGVAGQVVWAWVLTIPARRYHRRGVLVDSAAHGVATWQAHGC